MTDYFPEFGNSRSINFDPQDGQEFLWVRPTGGWEAIKARSEIRETTDEIGDCSYPTWSEPFDFLVPRYINGEAELYCPEQQNDSIFLEIPDPNRLDDVQVFCNKWGAPDLYWEFLAAPVSPKEMNPKEFLLETDLTSQEISIAGITTAGARFEDFSRIGSAIRAYEAICRNDLKAANAALKLWVRTFNSDPYNTERINFPLETLDECSAMVAAVANNASLMFGSTYQTFYLAEKREFKFVFKPRSLLGLAWYQFAQMLAMGGTLRSCEVCSKPMNLKGDARKRDKKYCSDACKMRAYRENKKKKKVQ